MCEVAQKASVPPAVTMMLTQRLKKIAVRAMVRLSRKNRRPLERWVFSHAASLAKVWLGRVPSAGWWPFWVGTFAGCHSAAPDRARYTALGTMAADGLDGRRGGDGS